MSRTGILVFLVLAASCGCSSIASAASPEAVTTYQSIGLSWQPAGGSDAQQVAVRYRRGTGPWKDGHALQFDGRPANTKVGETGKTYGQEYRGSIVNLAPGTSYEVELSLGTEKQTVTATTWADEKPVGETVPVANGSETLAVNKSGTATGYVAYDGSGAVLDMNNAQPNAVVVTASYVILRNLTIRGAQADAITLAPGVHDVIVEHNDVSGWGRIAPDAGKKMDGTPRPAAETWSFFWGEDGDAAIKCSRDGGQPTIDRITIQPNKLHDPRSGSNSWGADEARPVSKNSHPYGPQAIYAAQCGSNWVVRQNDVFSSPDHYFNDAMGGAQNFSDQGWPNADSDIYENHISDAWDEAIESEGANRNVRIWGNYLDKTFVKVALAGTQVGPVYVFRNVGDRSEARHAATTDQASRGPFLKTGSRNKIYPGGGRIYVFNNTVLQRPAPEGLKLPLGSGDGLVEGGGPTGGLVSLNNILSVIQPLKSSVMYPTVGPGANSFDFDLYNGALTGVVGAEAHGVVGSPVYDPSVAPFALAAGSPGVDVGTVIPGFTDGFTGAAPDIGAYER